MLKYGRLYGFWIGFHPIYPKLTKPDMLIPDTAKTLYGDNHITKRYGDSQEWKLITEETPDPCEYLFLLNYPHKNHDDEILPSDFEGDWVEAVVWPRFIEDHRGHFDGVSRLQFRLTEKGIADPDGVLQAFSQYGAYLVRK